MFGMVYIVFLMSHLGLGWSLLYSGWLSGMVDSEFSISEDVSLLGWVSGDLDDIFGILYVDYTISNDYLVFDLIYFVF